MKQRKIAVVSGTRADYGILFPLLKKIKSKNEFLLQIVAAGMHLSPEFGLTFEQIEEDGFKIDEKVEMLLSSDTEVSIAKSTGLGMAGFGEAFERLKPDFLILLGDRFETLASAFAAFIARIPIAHIHGGEVTEGAFDDAIRHSVTKMSQLHFVSTELYRKRVIQLGEFPNRVFNVGALGIDNIKKMKLLTKSALERVLDFKFGKNTVLVTFHPVTLEDNTSEKQFTELLKVLSSFKNLKIIFTKPNADTFGRIILKLIDNYVKKYSYKAKAFTSLGQLNYLSTVKYVDAVIGNSSSGIIEVPTFGVPTVNIGDRQKGRIRAESIIDCEPSNKTIKLAVKKALSREFKIRCGRVQNIYGDGNAAGKIYKILKKYVGKIKDTKKVFYDLKPDSEIERLSGDN
ncbi:MAG: UDP-N-acetylglucosamine 2-epimerase [bacterium]